MREPRCRAYPSEPGPGPRRPAREAGAPSPIAATMTISFDVPPEVDQLLRRECADPSAAAKELFLVDLYRRGRITRDQLGRALDLHAAQTAARLGPLGLAN